MVHTPRRLKPGQQTARLEGAKRRRTSVFAKASVFTAFRRDESTRQEGKEIRRGGDASRGAADRRAGRTRGGAAVTKVSENSLEAQIAKPKSQCVGVTESTRFRRFRFVRLRRDGNWSNGMVGEFREAGPVQDWKNQEANWPVLKPRRQVSSRRGRKIPDDAAGFCRHLPPPASSGAS